MPGKRKSNKKATGYALTKYKKGKYKKQDKAVICYCPQICPDVMRVQLKYVARKSPSGNTVVDIQDFVFRGNGCFDPDFATGGQQPLGFDEWSAFYRKYRVTGCKVALTCVNDSDSAVHAYIVMNNTSTAFTDKNQLIEQQYTNHKVVARTGDGPATTSLSMYKSTAKVRGGPVDVVQYQNGLAALTSANPNLEWFVHVGAYAQGNGSTTFSTDIEVLLTYYIDFFDRQTLIRS